MVYMSYVGFWLLCMTRTCLVHPLLLKRVYMKSSSPVHCSNQCIALEHVATLFTLNTVFTQCKQSFFQRKIFDVMKIHVGIEDGFGLQFANVHSYVTIIGNVT